MATRGFGMVPSSSLAMLRATSSRGSQVCLYVLHLTQHIRIGIFSSISERSRNIGARNSNVERWRAAVSGMAVGEHLA